jgi:hypothetical protein
VDSVKEDAMSLRGRVGRHTRLAGRHCQNWREDQQTIIDLLNRIPVAEGGAGGKLNARIIDGMCSDALYRAISQFEDKQFPGQRSGFVDPDGPLLRRMEELAFSIRRSLPNGRTDVIKAMGNTKWGDVELKRKK